MPAADHLWSPSVAVVGDKLVYDHEYELISLHDEVVLRELVKVDVHSLTEVRDFVAAFGVIDGRTVRGPTGNGRGGIGLPDPYEVVDGVRRRSPDWPDLGHIVHWRYVATLLSRLQSLSRHYVAHRMDEPVLDAWADDWKHGPLAFEGNAWMYFTLTLNDGLGASAYAPHLVAEESTEGLAQYGRPDRPDLYSALCLQLWNLIVEDVPVKVCPFCRSTFARQRGRSQHGQQRSSGVTFCSKACARAQANRDYRRRKREGKS